MTKPAPLDVSSHLDAMLRYARTLVRGSTTEADDLVHEALVKALEAEASFRRGGNLRGWLLSILHNTFVSQRRSRVAELRRVEAFGAAAETHAQPEQEGRARLTRVVEAFHDLPEDQRAVLHLVAIEGMAYQEAADALGVPVGTVMSRLSRAREALRRFEGEGRTDRRPPAFRIIGGQDAS
ncbi:sigma-70 family RNA polymerase sigma factor [Chthonobacter albigriseus]|uniref:sigma-70 family RNA polymerase sigma factor n=1 Tax=Chthonobacter albigriseus TaxID=1683161 RepID=UPI0015EE3A4D|nr:sigma-70 family RNA polymerase sigma factor [Chthonobacter albigriseus]